MHCLLIYPDLKTFREFYIRYIQRQIDERNEIILFNPFYETVGTVRQNLSRGYIDLVKFQHTSDISLIIADSLNQYFGKVPIAKFRKMLVMFAIKKKKQGVSILSDMGSYFFKTLCNELVDYELSLPKKYDNQVKGLCLYNQLDFDNRLSKRQKEELINHHGMAIMLKRID